MTGIARRQLLGRAAAAVGLALILGGHTPYRQWVVYRQRHLLIGCHREDSDGYARAKTIEAVLASQLPEAHARVARAPHAARLASLFNTGQLELGLLRPTEASAMREGRAPFAPYGAVPLLALATIDEHVLFAMPTFDADHAWLLLNALEHAGPMMDPPTAPQAAMPVHPGATEWFAEHG